MNRYFLISYTAEKEGKPSKGYFTLINYEGKMPNYRFIEETINKRHGLINLTISNIYEFKSRQDFLDFTL